jgi:hypothetical protein
MSYLAKLKQIENEKNFKNIPDNALPIPPKGSFGSYGSTVQGKNKKNLSNIVAITPKQIEKIQTWLNSIGEPENEHHVVIEKCRRNANALEYFSKQADEYAHQKRQEKLMEMLKAHPDKKRAYLTTETDSDSFILTIAIRDKATFEMEIPKAKYNPWLLAQMINMDLMH